MKKEQWKWKTAAVRVLAAAAVSVLLSGCGAAETFREEKQPEEDGRKAEPGITEIAELPDIQDIHLRDKELLYQNTDDTSVVTMYLTVSSGNAAENTDHTWEEINTWSVYDYAEMGVKRYQVNGLLQVGDENGPLPGMVGYGEHAPNATVQIRGQTSSRYSQKNYKIELKKNKGTWNGQRTIALNKHQADGIRFRNKLGFRMIQDIPQLMGLRTQFVHLYVKDETKGGSGKFEDYGLYTQVEQLNKTALRTHGLDENGHLYKVNFFEFYRYEDKIRLEEDPEFNLADFEGVLEIKGNRDHTKLIQMLEDVNDVSIPVEQVLEDWFDRENICYWMAFNILINNLDTINRNAYLYSPLNSNTWYFLPWDLDASLTQPERKIMKRVDGGSWQEGITNYWGNVLLQRCLKSESFRKELDDAIQDLRGILTEDYVRELVNRYGEVVRPYLYRMPDRMYAPLTEAEYETVLRQIPGEIEKSYEKYRDSLEKPMPFFIGVPENDNGILRLMWEPAYDLDAETIRYTVELASDYRFQNVIFHAENHLLTDIETPLPGPGQYFVRIRATNTSGWTQDAQDYYVAENGKNYGIKCFYIHKDGTIEEDIYEE